MIAAQEPEMRRSCPMRVKTLAVLALALGAAGALAQNDPAVQEPKVAPIKTQEMKPGYGVVESVTEVELVRERSAAAGGTAPGASSGRPMYRIGVRMPDGSLQFRDLDKPEFKVGDNVLLTNAGDIVPD
jgi:hypothetical protein